MEGFNPLSIFLLIETNINFFYQGGSRWQNLRFFFFWNHTVYKWSLHIKPVALIKLPYSEFLKHTLALYQTKKELHTDTTYSFSERTISFLQPGAQTVFKKTLIICVYWLLCSPFLMTALWLTHISLVSFLWDIDKQCKPRSEAAECGIWSGSPLFAYRMFSLILNKN